MIDIRLGHTPQIMCGFLCHHGQLIEIGAIHLLVLLDPNEAEYASPVVSHHYSFIGCHMPVVRLLDRRAALGHRLQMRLWPTAIISSSKRRGILLLMNKSADEKDIPLPWVLLHGTWRIQHSGGLWMKPGLTKDVPSNAIPRSRDDLGLRYASLRFASFRVHGRHCALVAP